MAKTFLVAPTKKISGTISVTGDKSISHRALMLGAIAEGQTVIEGLLKSEDVLSTLQVLKELGIEIFEENKQVIIQGRGLFSLKAPTKILDLGNSGTSIRLLSGILSAQSFDATLTGDDSLKKRPMRRILEPLQKMGAKISASIDDTAPIVIRGINYSLQAIDYTSTVASAQIKSCFLLASLYADGESVFSEPSLSRDHTERMLKLFEYPFEKDNLTIKLTGKQKLKATKVKVPGDFSSAAFFIVAATISSDSQITIQNIGINPTRIGLITILKKMGANIYFENECLLGDEPVADICIQSSKLKGIEVPIDLIPKAIDEFPILFIAAACAQGKTVLRGAKELRFKESDRISSMVQGLRTLGITVEEYPDGAVIEGGTFSGGIVDSYHDHRIAMAFAIAGCRASNPIRILHCDNIATSFPTFSNMAQQLGINIQVQEDNKNG